MRSVHCPLSYHFERIQFVMFLFFIGASQRIEMLTVINDISMKSWAGGD